METKMKKCNKCGRILPLDAFGTMKTSKDGKNYYCKECRALYERRRMAIKSTFGHDDTKRVSPTVKPTAAPLSKFTSRELIQELRNRHYYGKIEYVETIVI